MSRLSDFCDDGMCAAFAFVLAILLVLLGVEFLLRAACHALKAIWRAITRPCE